jgi:hypothetical protein
LVIHPAGNNRFAAQPLAQFLRHIAVQCIGGKGHKLVAFLARNNAQALFILKIKSPPFFLANK